MQAYKFKTRVSDGRIFIPVIPDLRDENVEIIVRRIDPQKSLESLVVPEKSFTDEWAGAFVLDEDTSDERYNNLLEKHKLK
jgi:hypothetical protein